MDGVLSVSWRPLPGAAAAVARLRDAGLPLRVITSTTARSRADIGSGLREPGFDFADEDLLTASVSAAAYLRVEHPDARVFRASGCSTRRYAAAETDAVNRSSSAKSNPGSRRPEPMSARLLAVVLVITRKGRPASRSLV